MTASLYTTEHSNDNDLFAALGGAALRCPIPHGDVVFWSKGDDGATLRVCCERKKIRDMANSIMGGRYLHQAQAAHDAGMDVLVLIVEGSLRPSPTTGFVEAPHYQSQATVKFFAPRQRRTWQAVKPEIAYSRFDQYLTELSYLAGIIVKRSANVAETAAIIKALYINFQTPPSQHNSLHQIYSAPSPKVLLCKPGLVRRVSKEIDNIGWERSAAVAARFHSVKEMVDADVKTWMSIDGIGRITAERAVDSLRGN